MNFYICAEQMTKTMDVKTIFSLSLDALRNLPGAVAMEDKAVIIDNTFSPFITSLTNEWENKPVILDEILVIFCTDGEINVKIAFGDYKLTENTVCVLTPGSIVEIVSVSSNFHCITLSFAKDFISADQSSALELLQLFKYIQRKPCNQLSGTYATRYRETFLETVKTANWQENPLRLKMIQAYIYLLFCCLYPVLEENKNISDNETNQTNQRRIYYKFMEFVQNDYRKHRTVAYYAKCLGLTPKYLSKVVQAESGYSAMYWIDSYVILESKALLKQANTSIHDVAMAMNFSDQSRFGKFFHRITGMSPKQYRELK